MNSLLRLALACGLLCPAGLLAHPHHPAPRPLPEKSYEKPAEQPATPGQYVIRLQQMITFYDKPGEFGHMMVGRDHGFKQLSLILMETQPNGGPPLHTHETEEAHVLTDGTASYVIVNPKTQERRTFTVNAPYVARIPAGFPHTFINAGKTPFRLIAIFPDDKFTYTEVGPNPLVVPAPPGAAATPPAKP
jgi:mannose-6-phosphate isomerase-like protein (cupin superfamily)